MSINLDSNEYPLLSRQRFNLRKPPTISALGVG